MERYSREIEIQAPIERVFHFHDDPNNLLLITPPDAGVSILETSGSGVGQRVLLSLNQFGILNLEWEVEITEFEPPMRMTDVQKQGPFQHWKQTREFFATSDSRTKLIDSIEYLLPLHTISQMIVGGVVKQKIVEMFEYRQTRLKEILENAK